MATFNLCHLLPRHYIVTRICRVSGMEGGTLWLHVIPE
ncbi:hypothetical protein EL75_4765 [Escherichia coli]|nr:hypothetical protein EL75_4765 [Escherichia coli]KGM73011.1 hypothetical protein EL80_5399 [Escherichia coli]KGM77582.1 hypothetical protein EL79_5151 [Escherichia coli]